ncbi:uncharacterized protein B0T23DRAFT_289796, partial [Neurospora hispaniola]
MPAILDDPSAGTIHRVSGAAPYPDPAHPSFPPTIVPRHVTLRDRQTVATVVPFASRHQVPNSLLHYLHDQFNKEIEGGDTYPMLDAMPFDKFADYWFQNFAGVMLLGQIERGEDIVDNKNWSTECLGTFYIKPNYPGRSSHICNAGFIVTDASRNRGVGRLMGETYLDWAPKLGYTYSVFNLVYETNVASCKIWDGLGFKRIGRVKGAGNLKSYPDRLVDAIIFGRDLGDAAGNEELVSEERFDKIKFYLKYGRYPNGADRAEKSRLRSAATHYKLVDGDILMLKDKEVISDPRRQYDIAREVHNQSHAGINRTTATIAERYHWSRIKETVSDVIRNCSECKELGKSSFPGHPYAASSSHHYNQSHPHFTDASGHQISILTSPSPGPPMQVTPDTTNLATVQQNPFTRHTQAHESPMLPHHPSPPPHHHHHYPPPYPSHPHHEPQHHSVVASSHHHQPHHPHHHQPQHHPNPFHHRPPLHPPTQVHAPLYSQPHQIQPSQLHTSTAHNAHPSDGAQHYTP